ncbi:(R)-specific enoyl-CoA hydratase [Lamellibrachia satsuma]|nr:(R)-specific enoyl-CoA hydratase [Lamellibrachia satsuma]
MRQPNKAILHEGHQMPTVGIRNITDGILIYGATQTEHDIAFEALFKRLEENGLTLNKAKCEFNRDNVEFFGIEKKNRVPLIRTFALDVGDKARVSRVFTETDVHAFADVTWDTNPLHFDKKFARSTRFRKPVVHGVLSLGLLAGVLGSQLPGPGSVVLSYTIEHPSPLFTGEEVVAEVELSELDRRLATFQLTCTVLESNKVVTKGWCKLLVPKTALSIS